jgi:hypothetical protein
MEISKSPIQVHRGAKEDNLRTGHGPSHEVINPHICNNLICLIQKYIMSRTESSRRNSCTLLGPKSKMIPTVELDFQER